MSDLARMLVQGKWMDELSGGEVKRLLSAINHANGVEEIEASVRKVILKVDLRWNRGAMNKGRMQRWGKKNRTDVRLRCYS